MSEILNPLVGASRVLVGQVAWAAVTGGLFIGVLWLTFRSLPRLLSPGVRATLWWLACLKLVVGLLWFAPVPLPVLPAPVTSSVNQQSVGQRAPEPLLPFSANSTEVTVVQQQKREATTPKGDTVGAVTLAAAFVWFVGLVLSFGMLLRRARRQASILRNSKPLADKVTERAVATIAARLGLRRPPVVRMTDGIDSPFVTGVIRPTLLLPTALWPRLTAAEREIAICHECVHIRRRDLFMRWIPILAERLFFFLPLARLAVREYVLCNEATCDARVLEVLPATLGEYGNLLLAFGVSNGHAPVLAVGSSSFAVLKRRIAMLAVPPTSSVASRSLAVALVVAAVVLLAPVRPVARSAEMDVLQPSIGTGGTRATQDTPHLQEGDTASASSVIVPVTPAAKAVVAKESPHPVTSQNASGSPQGELASKEAQVKELRDALLKAHMAVANATAKARAATTPGEQEQANKELAEAQARLRPLQDQYRALAFPGKNHEDVLAMDTKAMEEMQRLRKPPVIDPDAPTVTVTDFDKTATYDQPMHFRVVVTGSAPVPKFTVALRRIEVPESLAFFLTTQASPGFSPQTTDARTLTDFTIIPKCMGNCDISVSVTDEQGRTARWIAGTVVVNVGSQRGQTATTPPSSTTDARGPLYFITGLVLKPGPYEVRRPTTVQQAISLAGGTTEGADVAGVRISRLVNGKMVVLSPEPTDVLLPGDTVVVPERIL
jgi:beta-lactamase regulating signal transducer with metallopeptidase domain